MTEKDSPFVETKTKRIFKDSANVNLRGSTFDALHLDSFIASDYGDKRKNYYTQSKLSQGRVSKSNLRNFNGANSVRSSYKSN